MGGGLRDPVADREVEVWAVGQGDDVHAVRLLLVFGLHEDDECGVAPST
jgi:hypothetical protein